LLNCKVFPGVIGVPPDCVKWDCGKGRRDGRLKRRVVRCGGWDGTHHKLVTTTI